MKKEENKRSYCTCHAVCGIFSNIYGVWQSAAEDRINLSAMHPLLWIYKNGSVTFSPYSTEAFYIFKNHRSRNLCSPLFIAKKYWLVGFSATWIHCVYALLTLASPTEPKVCSINSLRMTLCLIYIHSGRSPFCVCVCVCVWDHVPVAEQLMFRKKESKEGNQWTEKAVLGRQLDYCDAD